MFLDTNNVDEVIGCMSNELINFVMIGEATEINIEQLIAKASSANMTIAGGIFPMVIHNNGYAKRGIVLKQIASEYGPTLLLNISKGIMPTDLPTIDDSIHSCMLIYDGFMKNTPRFLERLYEKYWNKISYVGAGAGSISLKQSPCIFTNEGLYEDAAFVLLTPREASLGVKHGWNKVAGPFVANKTDGNRIIELNWRPAFEVYKEVVEQRSGLSFGEDDFFNISKAYPFGIYREGMEDVIRDPLSVDESGAIHCIGEISQNVSLNIMEGDPDSLIDAASTASQTALSTVDPLDLFVVDCISRVLYLEDAFDRELAAVKHYAEGVDVEGVLSLGEISSQKGGFLELYNKTIVISAFH